ncbi:lantibiotic dehydratase [Streptomyces sp. NBC_01439]|uniref:lantibiotic dehydratase n=1 Tax=Streptomyces sp. NBC_01439 TaxID=2903867 RepID=UPI002E2D5AF6|nr:lantibiotic dehydratase [Streptomyces sp. NBC_01439]
MPQLQSQPHFTPGTDGYRVRSAPYALARATVLAQPAQPPAAAAFRDLLSRLHRLDTELSLTTAPLCDDLYAARDDHPADFHRDTVLPLRRALHNRREPRPALLVRLGDLPARLPRLATWLALRADRDTLLAALDATCGPALDAERTSLAALCREPAFAKATALTSADLLRAINRAAAGTADRRARKEEPTVLRYALRASTKTSPLSWFTAVGWGPLAGRPADGPTHPVASWGTAPVLDGPLRSVVRTNRTLTTALTLALLDAPHRRTTLPHRITSTARIADARTAYTRDRPSFAGGRYLVPGEDEAEVASSNPLRLLTHLAENPVPLADLTQHLAAALCPSGPDGPPGPPGLSGPDDSGDGRAAVAAFLDRLTHADLLVPQHPLAPQDRAPLQRLDAWVRTFAPDHPEDAHRADRIAELGSLTARFAAAPAADRPGLLTDLTQRWTAELAAAGRPVPTGSAPLTVLSEDVIAARPLTLDGFLDAADHEALAEVTALAELFDLGHLVRRALRDRFVERYGPGGRCAHPWEFGADVTAAWETAGRIARLDPADRDAFPTGTEPLARLRAEITTALRDHDGPRYRHTCAPADEAVLPADTLKTLGERLPAPTLERPLSYTYFLQRDPATALLAVNHVYGGWGRFTSRFLDFLDPRATAEVSRQIRRGLGPGARPAQIRPVSGFNANLHPLLVPDEIGPDRDRTPIAEADLELVHDEATDQVRIHLKTTGEPLDVLYPGFLAPVLLPARIAPHLADHPGGVVDFRPLAPRRTLDAPGGQVTVSSRLRHRHVVLQRRRWLLPPAVVAQLRADLAADTNPHRVPTAATAHWRALLGLPEQVFLHPVAGASTGRATEDFLSHLARPKPHLADLGNALHLRCLAKWLSRHTDGVVLEEALPAPGGLATPARAVELALEVYRVGRPR